MKRELMRTWTDQQWDDAERVNAEIATMLGEDGCQEDLICLVIEERKRDPATTVKDVVSLAITLGVESLFQLRHAALKGRDVASLAKARRSKKSQKRAERTRGVRGV